MTRERLIKHWDCVVALRDGKTVQTLSAAGIWEDDPSPSFTDSSQHRVKPEPREVWAYEFIHMSGESTFSPIFTDRMALAHSVFPPCTITSRLVKFREVLE